MEDRVIIQRIIEIMQTSGEDMTDGECLEAISEIIETKYIVYGNDNGKV
jgi:hypothetical protein